MRENRTYGSEGGVSRWLIPTTITECTLHTTQFPLVITPYAGYLICESR